MSNIHVIFDGPPAHESGRFIEVENDQGASINVGEWKDRGDGTWELIIPRPTVEDHANLCAHGAILCAPCNYIPESWGRPA